MVTNNTYYYGIKYKTIKIDDNNFLLFPVDLVGGLSDNVSFSTDQGNYAILRNKNSFTNKYVVSNVFYTNDLEKKYNYYDDTNILGKYFFEDNSKIVLYAEVLNNGNLRINKMDTGKYERNKLHNEEAIYYYEDKDACVKLNETIYNQIEACDDIDEIKRILRMYKISLEHFKEFNDDSVTRIDTVNNKITSIDINKNVEEEPYKDINISKDVKEEVTQDISNKGLYDAIRERVFGHDNEIRIISRRLYRNHLAKDGRKIKSIMIVGPSGTGKTETVKAAANYLGVPYAYVNASDLVPTGIVGPKIEDFIAELLHQSGKDQSKAEKGLFFIDEYDKIGNLEVKEAVKPSLLSFNGGEKILLPQIKKGFIFDTSKLNRLYGGVFERLWEKSKKLGFGIDKEEVNKEYLGPEIKRAIIEKGYFTKEDLGRISTFIKYDQLDLETKKDILLHCKTSALLDTIKGYKDDFGIDVEVTDEFLNAFLESIPEDEGIRDIAGYLDETLDGVEEELCNHPKDTYKRLVLKKEIVDDHSKFDLF